MPYQSYADFLTSPTAAASAALRTIPEQQESESRLDAMTPAQKKYQGLSVEPQQPVDWTEPDEGLLAKAGRAGWSALEAAGNLFDVPGSVVRDIAAIPTALWGSGGANVDYNPLDQLLPWNWMSGEGRTSGRDLLRSYGAAGEEDTWTNLGTGIGAEVLLDPLTYLTFGASAVGKGGRALQKTKDWKMLREAATANAKSGTKISGASARQTMTPDQVLQYAAKKEAAETGEDFATIYAAKKEAFADAARKKAFNRTDTTLTDEAIDAMRNEQVGGLFRVSNPFGFDIPFTGKREILVGGGDVEDLATYGTAGEHMGKAVADDVAEATAEAAAPKPKGPEYTRLRDEMAEAAGNDEADATMAYWETVAERYAENNGVDPEEFYRMAKVKRGEKGEFGGVVLYQSGPDSMGFYSKLKKTVEEKVGGKTTKEQLLGEPKSAGIDEKKRKKGTLENAGVKDEEIEWADLDLLFESNPKPTKDEISAWLDANSVDGLEETVLDGKEEWRQATPDWLDSQRAKDSRGRGFPAALKSSGEGIRIKDWDTTPNLASGGKVYGTLDSGEDVAVDLADIEYYHAPENLPRHERYKTPGGENYREVLLQLPRKLGEPSTAKKADYGYEVFDSKGNSWGAFTGASEADAIAEAKLVGQPRGESQGFKAPHHWDEEDVLVHIRMQDRTGPNGEKILQVEEIQSDWHQQGRKKGYKGDLPAEEKRTLAADREALEKEREVLEAIRTRDVVRGVDKIKEMRATGYSDEAIEKALEYPGEFNDEFQRRLYDIQQDIQNIDKKLNTGVPNAPFKKSWPALAMKRVIKEAVDGGYDKVAWTGGREQAERYNLRKSVNSIDFGPDPGGEGKLVQIDMAAGKTVSMKVDLEGKVYSSGLKDTEGKQLDDILGKEISEKIMAGDAGVLKGDDLAVGGEGMTGFYDKMLPTVLDKYAKKWGAKAKPTSFGQRFTGSVEAKVDDVFTDTDKVDFEELGDDILEEYADWSRELEENYHEITGVGRAKVSVDGVLAEDMVVFKSNADTEYAYIATDSANGMTYHASSLDKLQDVIRDDYKRKLVGSSGGFDAHEFEVTDKMRKSVKTEGQPLFQDKKGQIEFDKDMSKAVITLFESGDISTLAHESAHFFRRYLGQIDKDLLEQAQEAITAATKVEFVDGKWSTEAEEYFATSFERYLRDGKAPNDKLKDAFKKLKKWMVDIYEKLKGTPVEKKTKLHDVFDQMLGAKKAAEVDLTSKSVTTLDGVIDAIDAVPWELGQAAARTEKVVPEENYWAMNIKQLKKFARDNLGENGKKFVVKDNMKPQDLLKKLDEKFGTTAADFEPVDYRALPDPLLKQYASWVLPGQVGRLKPETIIAKLDEYFAKYKPVVEKGDVVDPIDVATASGRVTDTMDYPGLQTMSDRMAEAAEQFPMPETPYLAAGTTFKRSKPGEYVEKAGEYKIVQATDENGKKAGWNVVKVSQDAPASVVDDVASAASTPGEVAARLKELEARQLELESYEPSLDELQSKIDELAEEDPALVGVSASELEDGDSLLDEVRDLLMGDAQIELDELVDEIEALKSTAPVADNAAAAADAGEEIVGNARTLKEAEKLATEIAQQSDQALLDAAEAQKQAEGLARYEQDIAGPMGDSQFQLFDNPYAQTAGISAARAADETPDLAKQYPGFDPNEQIVSQGDSPYAFEPIDTMQTSGIDDVADATTQAAITPDDYLNSVSEIKPVEDMPGVYEKGEFVDAGKVQFRDNGDGTFSVDRPNSGEPPKRYEAESLEELAPKYSEDMQKQLFVQMNEPGPYVAEVVSKQAMEESAARADAFFTDTAAPSPYVYPLEQIDLGPKRTFIDNANAMYGEGAAKKAMDSIVYPMYELAKRVPGFSEKEFYANLLSRMPELNKLAKDIETAASKADMQKFNQSVLESLFPTINEVNPRMAKKMREVVDPDGKMSDAEFFAAFTKKAEKYLEDRAIGVNVPPQPVYHSYWDMAKNAWQGLKKNGKTSDPTDAYFKAVFSDTPEALPMGPHLKALAFSEAFADVARRVEDSWLGRQFTANFWWDRMGSSQGGEFTSKASEGYERAKAEANGAIAKLVPVIHHHPALNIKPVMKKIAEANPDLDEEALRLAATQQVVENKMEIWRYIEHARDYRERGEAYDWPEFMAEYAEEIEPAANKMIDLIDKAFEAEKLSGIAVTDLMDREMFVGYMARRKQGTEVKGGKQSSSELYQVTHPSQIKRKDFLTNIPGGTYTINKLSLDPDISGIWYKKKKATEDEADALVEKMLNLKAKGGREYDFGHLDFRPLQGIEKHKDKIKELMSKDSSKLTEADAAAAADILAELPGEHGSSIPNLIDLWTKYNKDKEQAYSLARYIASLNPGYKEAVTPLFNLHFMDLGSMRVNRSYRAVAAADAIVDFLASPNSLVEDASGIDLIFASKRPVSATSGSETADYAITLEKFLEEQKGLNKDAILQRIAEKANRSVEEVSKEFVHRNAIKHVKAVMHNYTGVAGGEDTQGYLKTFANWYNNVFRANVTGPFAAFHVRNVVSSHLMGFMAGYYGDPRDLRSARAMFGSLARADKFARGENVNLKALKDSVYFKGVPEDEINDRVRELAYKHSMISGDQGIMNDVGQVKMETVESGYPGLRKQAWYEPYSLKREHVYPEGKMPDGTTELDKFNPFKTAGTPEDYKDLFGAKLMDRDAFYLTAWGRNIASHSENVNRLGPFIELLTQGYSPERAAELSKAINGDYSKLTNTERSIKNFAIPFYSFSRRVYPVIFGDLAQRPAGPRAQLLRLNRALSDDSPKPDYIEDSIAMELFEKPDGTKTYLTGLGLPMEQALSFIGIPAALLGGDKYNAFKPVASMLNQPLKFAAESATGVSLYQQGGEARGRRLDEMDPLVGRIMSNIGDVLTGSETKRADPFISQDFEHVMANLPFSRYLSTARKITDPRKWQDAGSVAANALDNLSGIKLYDVSEGAQDSILRQRLSEIAEDMGIRKFTGLFRPEWLKLSPEEEAQWRALQAEERNIKKRRDERVRQAQER